MLVSVGGGVVVDAGTLALTVVPVRAGTCDWHAPLVVMPRVVIQHQVECDGVPFCRQ